MAAVTSATAAGLRARVRLSTADFATLDRLYPGVYPRVIRSGDGAYLVDDAGRRLLDSGAHMGACQVGHARAEIAARIGAQAAELEFATLDAGFGHAPAVELAERLGEVLPLTDPLFMFSASGSEANEAAIKVARAFHAARGEPRRVKILCRAGSYHGSTYAAMSATGIPPAREPFAPLVGGFVRVGQPSPGRCGFCSPESGCRLDCAAEVERAIEREGPGTIAAMIGEPVAFREAVKVPDARYWPAVREICDRYGVLLILDEVITGFGRTGRMFGAEHWAVKPDLFTLAKGMTSGYMAMSACVLGRHVADVLRRHPIAHISTFAGHPVASAAALANLRIIQEEGLVERARRLEPVVRERMSALQAARPSVTRHSVIGLLGSVEFGLAAGAEASEASARLAHELYERGVIARTAAEGRGGVVYFYPPLIVTDADVRLYFSALDDAVAELERSGVLG